MAVKLELIVRYWRRYDQPRHENTRRHTIARLPYADLSESTAKPVIDRIIAERGSVLHLYQMLLHSPPVADGWLALLTAVRQKCSFSGALREMIIMRVADLNGARYEADQHAPIALHEGVSQSQIDELTRWEGSSLFSHEQRTVLRLTDEMTLKVQVAPELVLDARSMFDDAALVEIVVTIASYNMVSRVIEALGIHSHDERPPL
jgi:AhpD family alkylhydroperoxidase